MLLKETVSLGLTNTPLNFEEATPMLCILDEIDPENLEVPRPISSFIPRLLTSSVLISGGIIVIGTSIVIVSIFVLIKSLVATINFSEKVVSLTTIPSFDGTNS
jgi:hypothetical protein